MARVPSAFSDETASSSDGAKAREDRVTMIGELRERTLEIQEAIRVDADEADIAVVEQVIATQTQVLATRQAWLDAVVSGGDATAAAAIAEATAVEAHARVMTAAPTISAPLAATLAAQDTAIQALSAELVAEGAETLTALVIADRGATAGSDPAGDIDSSAPRGLSADALAAYRDQVLASTDRITARATESAGLLADTADLARQDGATTVDPEVLVQLVKDGTELNRSAHVAGDISVRVTDVLLDRDSTGRADHVGATIGTDPDNIDTDDEGLTDLDEVESHVTNSLERDTDDDGLGHESPEDQAAVRARELQQQAEAMLVELRQRSDEVRTAAQDNDRAFMTLMQQGVSVDDPAYLDHLRGVQETWARGEALRAEFDQLEATVGEAEYLARASGDQTLLAEVQATEAAVDSAETGVGSAMLEADTNWVMGNDGSYAQESFSEGELYARIQVAEDVEDRAEGAEAAGVAAGGHQPESETFGAGAAGARAGETGEMTETTGTEPVDDGFGSGAPEEPAAAARVDRSDEVEVARDEGPLVETGDEAVLVEVEDEEAFAVDDAQLVEELLEEEDAAELLDEPGST